MLDALITAFNSAPLRIYDGSQPANADTAITTQVLLAELRFGNPAFGASAAGAITANAITSEDSCLANGTATWFRMLKSDGTTVIMDGTVGTSGANLNLSSVSLTVGTAVEVTSFVHTIPRG